MPAAKKLKRTSTYLTPGGARKKRKTQRAAISTSVPRGLSLRKQTIQPELKATFRYTKVQEIGSIGGSAAYVIYRMSPYDPEYALGGTQPRGWNQLESLYRDYRVDSVSIEVRAHNITTNTRPYMFIAARPTGIEVPDWRDINENPDKIIARKAMNRGSNDDAAGPGFASYQTMTCIPHKLLGLKDKTDADLVASVTSSPEKDYYFYVGAIDPHSTNAIAVDCSITVTYNCTMMNPKDLGSSA